MEKIKNNDVLKSLRYILNAKDSEMTAIFALGGYNTDEVFVRALLAKEDRANFTVCSDDVMESFLNGLIIHKRGPSDKKESSSPKEKLPLTNNTILKKLRIAFDLKEEDMFSVFDSADVFIEKEELTGMFRREGHKHYISCTIKNIKDFLKGLTVKYRGEEEIE